jgi:hypothetical protein
MSIHTDNLANGKLIQQKPEYRCSSCGDYFPGDQLEEVPYRDPQNGEWLDFLFCHKSECQDRKRRQLL